uniref:Uncharacterized protein n=1 Tax=Leersia perrieri TaxID=77586 RepID=A0A0D9X7J0_9ORYZ
MAAVPGELPHMRMIALFACGSLLIRGAGCTINDLFDGDIDKKVERTKSRPLGSGIWCSDPYTRTVFLGVFSLLLVFSYPLIKRFTFWPQAYLGLIFNWGICWTLVYETIYAHQDKEDDLKVGVKSTALRLKSFLTAWPYYPFLAAASAQLAWQISTVDLSDRVDCNKKFVSN